MASRLNAAGRRTKHLIVFAILAAGFGAILLPAAAYAGVSSNVTATAVSVSAICSGSPGATFTITGPDGKTFSVSTPNSDTAGFETAGKAKGTYRFTAMCANGTNAGSGSFVIAPTGGPMGGDGGKTATTGFLAAGFLLLGAAACGGILLRRRATARR
ncbi:MAG TPA: hypothetical protein VFC19_53230 [Candidatus Limnocylindrales bacterium]|nr:hypothetical protein [Candidatus Limnocylindrales bacterium]